MFLNVHCFVPLCCAGGKEMKDVDSDDEVQGFMFNKLKLVNSFKLLNILIPSLFH